jgi:hypothetical protein
MYKRYHLSWYFISTLKIKKCIFFFKKKKFLLADYHFINLIIITKVVNYGKLHIICYTINFLNLFGAKSVDGLVSL